MSFKKVVEDYLKIEPLFRERKNKDQGIVNLLINRYPFLGQIEKKTLIAAVQDYNSMDRQWRQTLEKNPHLRGKDYDEKSELERKKLEELGYRAGGGVRQKQLPDNRCFYDRMQLRFMQRKVSTGRPCWLWMHRVFGGGI